MKKDESVLDLYCGAGGSGTGFARYFNVVSAVDTNHNACQTYQLNHHQTKVHETQVDYFIESVVRKDYEGVVFHGMIGGPPCQEFSRLNRQKDYLSKRAKQMSVMINAIIQMKPRFAMVENVATIPEHFKNMAIKTLNEAGYRTVAKIYNANLYGSVQTRKRWILTACKTHYVIPELEKKKHHRIASEIITDAPSEFGMKSCVRDKIQSLPAGKWWYLPGQTWKGYYVVDPNKPLPAVINIVKNRLIHPNRQQYLCWADCIAAFGFPRTYQFVGGKTSLGQQLANAVPVELAETFAKAFYSPNNLLKFCSI
jgi:DNA (cytosine-5)-methyltransferase 1